MDKIEKLATSLRTQVTTYLLRTNTEWKKIWASDPKTDERMEEGTVPTTLSQFEAALQRPDRWVCGLTLQAAATLKQVNIAIFKLVDDCTDFVL